jgi:uncharacterized oligopeptide transporter (OPT) family protein
MQMTGRSSTVPLFGDAAARYGWRMGANVGYIGQGMIMGPRVCASMLAGSLVGFALLAPLAVARGWADPNVPRITDPHGPVAWVSWISLSVMLADSVVSLALLLVRYALAALHRRGAQDPLYAAFAQSGNGATAIDDEGPLVAATGSRSLFVTCPRCAWWCIVTPSTSSTQTRTATAREA